MASSQSLPESAPPNLIEAASPDSHTFVLHLNDNRIDFSTLATHPWTQRSKIDVILDPSYDSPDPDQPHMVDFNNGPAYMNYLVHKAKLTASLLSNILQESINAGQLEIRLVFGEC